MITDETSALHAWIGGLRGQLSLALADATTGRSGRK